MRKYSLMFSLIALITLFGLSSAQDDFAATMDVLLPGVEVQRVNTSQRIPVSVEAIVGVGDTIYTTDGARARVNFFDDGTSVVLEPNSSYRIEEFRRTGADSFILRASVLAGEVVQNLNRELDDDSAYIVETPAMRLSARGTVFAVRVENDDRSSTVVRDGNVRAENDDSETGSDVRAGFGVRAAPDSKLSDVVEVNSFSQLDSYLDGCAVNMPTPDDVALNVRLGPSLDAPRVSFVDASGIDLAMGTVPDTEWYRIRIADSFGWVLSSTATIDAECAGLREFTADHLEAPESYDPQAHDLPVLFR
jgi:hypothetical protein